MMFPSLRSRLIAIILAPLFVIATLTSVWQFLSETERAQATFDSRLLSAALAISRDVAFSDGDALSPATRALINNTSGGEIFYHVYAPDGVFVTGYATPPVSPGSSRTETADPVYYDARYQGLDVRALRFQYATTVADVSGVYSVTVWQDAAVRSAFVRDVVTRSIAVSALIIVSVGFVVWVGVGFGLRPLLELEDAIASRTPTDLNPIKRDVPAEARGIVTTLNALLDRISRRISSKDEFISNAAHQLRNPVAGVLALAEAVKHAPSHEAAQKRSIELVEAARDTSRLTNQLLSFERAAGSDVDHAHETLSLTELVADAVARFEPLAQTRYIRVTCDFPNSALRIKGDPVMLREALLNLLNNAAAHGGPDMDAISVRLYRSEDAAHLIVSDNGIGIPADKRAEATMRFAQVHAGPGSGLGLAIASRVVTSHGGQLKILDADRGAAIQITLPL